MPGGGAPYCPVSIIVIPSSGVIIRVEEEHRSSPALPGVALQRDSVVEGHPPSDWAFELVLAGTKLMNGAPCPCP